MPSTTVRPTTWGLFVAGLLLALLAAAPARAVCITDELGPDDVPGQKDLNEWCEPGPTCSSSSPTASLKWQFDDVNWTGSNTGDSCALIDTNRDGLADRAICVTVFGAARMAGKCSNNQFLGCITNKGCGSGGTCIFPSNNTGAPRCYTCGNDRPTRCTNPQPVVCTSLCSVGVAVGSDPFSGVASHTARKCNGTNCVTNDTAVNCCLTSTDIGTSGELIDVCSYPSQQPNSDPSDCVITPSNCSSDTDCDDRNPCTVDKRELPRRREEPGGHRVPARGRRVRRSRDLRRDQQPVPERRLPPREHRVPSVDRSVRRAGELHGEQCGLSGRRPRHRPRLHPLRDGRRLQRQRRLHLRLLRRRRLLEHVARGLQALRDGRRL